MFTDKQRYNGQKISGQLQTVRTMVAVLLGLVLAAAVVSEAITPEQKVEQLKSNVAELFKQGNYKQAIPVLKNILEINPLDKTASLYLMIAEQQEVEPFCKIADEAFQIADYKKAIEEWEKILKIHPTDMRAEKQIELARNLIRENMLEAMYVLVDKFLKEGKQELAVNELEKILQIAPDEKQARELLIATRQALTNARIKSLYEKADTYMKEGKIDLAIEEWKRVLKIDEKQEEASRLIASARRMNLNSMYAQAEQLYRDGNYVASRDMYDDVMAENPTDEDLKKIFSRLSNTIKVVQRVEGEGLAKDMLRKALANHVSLDGDPKVAIAAAWYAEQLEPNSELVFAVRSFLEREHLMVYRSMEPPIRDMNIIDQYLFAALNNIYEGRYDLAIEESSIVIALEPNNVLALKRLGSAFFAMGKKNKARESWERALKLSPNDKELKKFIQALK